MPYSGSPERPRRPYRAPDHPAAHVADRLDGQLHDVEQVRGQGRAGQHPAHRRGVDGAQIDAHDHNRVSPGRGGAGQPVRGVIGGAAFHQPQQALLARQRDKWSIYDGTRALRPG
jgi:hypothetical protein